MSVVHAIIFANISLTVYFVVQTVRTTACFGTSKEPPNVKPRWVVAAWFLIVAVSAFGVDAYHVALCKPAVYSSGGAVYKTEWECP